MICFTVSGNTNEILNDGLKLSNSDKDVLMLIQQDRYKTNAQLDKKCGKSKSTI